MNARGLVLLWLAVGCDGELRFAATPDGGDATPGGETSARCRDDSQCRPSSLHCDPGSGACVPCLTDVHCTEERARRCDIAAHRCVECGVSADCSSDHVCDPVSKRCARPCADASSCVGTETPACDPRGVCVCTSGSCTSGERRLCGPTGRCEECISDAQCSGSEPRCHATRGVCVECAAASDCSAEKPFCDLAKGECASD